MNFDKLYDLSIRESILGSHVREVIEEGLISSMPMNMFRQHVQTMKGFHKIGPVFDNSSFNVAFDLGYDTQKQFIEKFNSDIYVYGYFIGVIKGVSNNIITFSLEMKFPTMIPSKDILEYPWYHITNSLYVDKILKNGLGPRESTTSFNHSGNVVYVIQVSDDKKSILNSLAKDLYNKKLSKIKLNDDMTRIKKWEDSHMVVLKIEISENTPIRYDPSCALSNNYRAGFLSGYLSPYKITLTDILK